MSSRPVPHERVARAPLVRHPHRHGATHKSQLERKILEKEAMGFAGGGVGRRDSGVRRVDDYRGTYETVGRIGKSGDEPGFRVPLRPLFFRK